MAKAKSISLSKFTASVQGAVQAAVQKQPKFAMALPASITAAYLIRGIPIPDAILNKVTLGETQAFASAIAAKIGVAHPQAFGAKLGGKGAVLSVGGRVIIGIPVVDAINLTK